MYDVIIIGSGPAGLTAAIYATRANLKTLIIGGVSWGGQLMLTTEVENFPGFPQGIMGPDLMANMRKQSEKFGAEIIEENFTRLQFPSQSDGGQASGEVTPSKDKTFKVNAGEKTFEGRAIIIATGADTKWLDVPGEREKIGRGVSTCAPCDGPFFKNKDIIVVGGGDSAMEEAEVMTRYAASVTLIHRRDIFRASKIMQDKIKKNPKIKILLDTQVSKVLGDFKVTGVELLNVKTGERREMPIDGVFVAIGHIPNTAVFKGIDLDEKGYIKVYEHTKTNVEGVFVAGDVHDIHYKQAITAAGFGCMAALQTEKWLMEKTDLDIKPHY